MEKTRNKAKKIILDVDPGHDDAVAMILAAASERIDLLGITVVAGNHYLERTLTNALQICNYCGISHVPVYGGMSEPLVREQIIADDIHGESGLDGPDFPPLQLKPASGHAVDFIIEQGLKADGDLTLVPTGPLTNIAMALKQNPACRQGFKEIVLMGGAYGVGNTTPSAEFNIFADPEAAAIVFNSGLPITMIGLDLTHQAKVLPEVKARIRAVDNRVSSLILDLLEVFEKKYREIYGFAGAPLHDVCAVARVIEPDIITTRKMRVDIELNSGLCYGRTVCDLYNRWGKEANAEVAVELDQARFWDLLIENLKKY